MPFTVTTMVSGSIEQFLTVPWMWMSAPGQAVSGSRSAVSSTQGRSLQRTDTDVFASSLPHELLACAVTSHETLFPATQAPMLTSRLNGAEAPAARLPEKTWTPPTETV